MSTSLWQTASQGASVGTATIASATGILTKTTHGLVEGQQVLTTTPTGGAVGVLVPNAPYFASVLTVDTFRLRPSPGGPTMTFASDGGVAVFQVAGQYDSLSLRQAFAGLFARGDLSGGFNCRPGVLPRDSSTSHVTTSGMTWTVADLVAVVQHATDGMFLVPRPTTNGTVPSADPAQPRLDGIDLGWDGTVTYVTGTPGAVPVAPAVTASSERLSTVSVLAAAGSSTIATGPRFTVPRGGVIPVANAAAYPAAGGRYEGLVLWNMETNELVVNMNAGGTWSPIASPTSFASLRRDTTVTRISNSSGFASETVVDTISVPVVSGKTYRIRWGMDVSTTVANDLARARVREDNLVGTVRQLKHIKLPDANQDFGATLEFDWTAASTTTKVFVGTIVRHLGSGTFSANSSANEPTWFTAEYVSG